MNMKVQSAGIEEGNKAHGSMSPSSKKTPPIATQKNQPKKPMATKLKSQMMARTLAASKATSKTKGNNSAYLS